MIRLMHGDTVEQMRTLPSESFDACVTDPPSGIGFMNAKWDHDKGGRRQWVAWMTEVFTEVYRVLKPGAHGLVWALPRTSHWTAWALEDAGFEVRDSIVHLFGSGFPKSLDVSKAIDKAAGAEREITGWTNPSDPRQSGRNGSKGAVLSGSVDGSLNRGEPLPISAPATPEAAQWAGWGTALKPSAEIWWLIRKPLSEKTVAANVLKHGTGALNIEQSRIRPVGPGAGVLAGMRCSSLDTPALLGSQPASLESLRDALRSCASALRSCSTSGTDLLHDEADQDDTSPSVERCGESGRPLLPSVLLHDSNWKTVPDSQDDCPSCRDFGDVHARRIGESALGSALSLSDVLDDIALEISEHTRNRSCVCIGHPSSCGALTRCAALARLLGNSTIYSLPPDRSDIQGRWPPNVAISHNGPDENGEGGCQEVGTRRVKGSHPGVGVSTGINRGATYGAQTRHAVFDHVDADGLETVPAFECVESCAVRLLDEQAGERRSAGNVNPTNQPLGYMGAPDRQALPINHRDSGSASRFFYTSKASAADRRPYNDWPTVKSTDLMRWLITLVTPPGGQILDPFAGSGSTLVAADRLGFSATGIDSDAHALDIARRRLAEDGGMFSEVVG